MAKINVKQTDIWILKIQQEDYISLTDIAKFKTSDSFIVIGNWMRNRNTVEYLGVWETLYNPNFKPIEFDRFRQEAGPIVFTQMQLRIILSERPIIAVFKIMPSLTRLICLMWPYLVRERLSGKKKIHI